MDKCRKAFEAKYKELNPDDKCTLMVNGNYSGWIKQAHWWAWQSRQSEFDAMTEALLNQTQLLAKQKVEVEEKDKRIQSIIQCIKENQYSTLRNKQLVVNVDDLERALRGEHE